MPTNSRNKVCVLHTLARLSVGMSALHLISLVATPAIIFCVVRICIETEGLQHFRTFRYNVPPSNEFCDDSSAYDFFYSETQECEDTDNCIKLSVIQKGNSFARILNGEKVMRKGQCS